MSQLTVHRELHPTVQRKYLFIYQKMLQGAKQASSSGYVWHGQGFYPPRHLLFHSLEGSQIKLHCLAFDSSLGASHLRII